MKKYCLVCFLNDARVWAFPITEVSDDEQLMEHKALNLRMLDIYEDVQVATLEFTPKDN